MKKPEKSLKRRKAAQNRAAKRNERFKKTQKEKTFRIAKKKEALAAEKKKFDQHLERLVGTNKPL